MLINAMRQGNKGKQVYHISVYKNFMQMYITTPEQIQAIIVPLSGEFVKLLMMNKVGDGIRVSALLSLFVPNQYHIVAREMVVML